MLIMRYQDLIKTDFVLVVQAALIALTGIPSFLVLFPFKVFHVIYLLYYNIAVKIIDQS